MHIYELLHTVANLLLIKEWPSEVLHSYLGSLGAPYCNYTTIYSPHTYFFHFKFAHVRPHTLSVLYIVFLPFCTLPICILFFGCLCPVLLLSFCCTVELLSLKRIPCMCKHTWPIKLIHDSGYSNLNQMHPDVYWPKSWPTPIKVTDLYNVLPVVHTKQPPRWSPCPSLCRPS